MLTAKMIRSLAFICLLSLAVAVDDEKTDDWEEAEYKMQKDNSICFNGVTEDLKSKMACVTKCMLASDRIELMSALSARQFREALLSETAYFPSFGDLCIDEGYIEALRKQYGCRCRSRKTKRDIDALLDTDPSRKWANPISFKFDPTASYSAFNADRIRDAFLEISTRTCVKFVEDNTATANCLKVVNNAGCAASFGKVPGLTDCQNIALQQIVCTHGLGTTFHEILHTLGFAHEHQRPDRDDFVTVNWANIMADELKFYEKLSNITQIGPYDYGSVMQSRATAYATSGFSLEAKDPDLTNVLGQRAQPSFQDIKSLNTFYCPDVCEAFPELTCEHGGYRDPSGTPGNPAANCHKCVCPEMFTGDDCSELITNDEVPKCPTEQFITVNEGETKSISVRDYFNEIATCAWKVSIGTEGYALKMEFTGHMEIGRITPSIHHWLEVRPVSALDTVGPRFSGTVKPDPRLYTENLVLIFESHDFLHWGRPDTLFNGFTVSFSLVRECGGVPCNGDCLETTATISSKESKESKKTKRRRRAKSKSKTKSKSTKDITEILGDGVDICTDIDDCFFNPCLNDGTCTDLEDGYLCSCPTGYSGTNCEIEPVAPIIGKDAVAAECINCVHGTCKLEGGDSVCECRLGYTGDSCDFPVAECQCQDGKVCVKNGDDVECQCPNGYTGPECNEDINECLQDLYKCHSLGAVCINEVGSFRCLCVKTGQSLDLKTGCP